LPLAGFQQNREDRTIVPGARPGRQCQIMADLARNAHEPPRRLPLRTKYPPGGLSRATIATERSCHPWRTINWGTGRGGPGLPPVRSPARDTFLALAVTSRLCGQPVTFIEAEFRRHLDKDPAP